jgi:hypothetical protein
VSDLIAKALVAAKECRWLDFKREADLTAAHTWPELVKDILRDEGDMGDPSRLGRTRSFDGVTRAALEAAETKAEHELLPAPGNVVMLAARRH